jgi:hypothetical protein
MPVMDEFGLERVKEALHRGIVIAVGFAAHRGHTASTNTIVVDMAPSRSDESSMSNHQIIK